MFNSNFFPLIVFLCSVVSCTKKAEQTDWPQFKKDTYRSANTSVSLDLKTLGMLWKYKTAQPVPAWYGPAKEDAYAVSGPLPSMRDYDLSYYPIIVGDNLFYGSSSDNSVHCLDANTGAKKWNYVTDGPIRIAPTYYNGNVYVGSDDGYVYCLNAGDGSLIWKYSPSDQDYQKVFQNRYFVSFWPVRTGVLVEDGIAYFGASLLPWKPSYFCAVNAKNGKQDIEGTYVKKIDNLTLEGAMASTGSKIIQPQGRIAPMFFDKKTGESKGQISGAGGCFVLVTPEKRVIHSQTSRNKTMVESILDSNKYVSKKQKDKNANFISFKGGKEIVVQGGLSFILTDNALSGFDRTSQRIVWLKKNTKAHRIIFAGNAVYVGGANRIYAVSPKNGETIWEHKVKGTVYAIAAANDALYASTDGGYIYCFKKGLAKQNILWKNKDLAAKIDKVKPVKKMADTSRDDFAEGPFISPLTPSVVAIDFALKKPSNADVFWYENDKEIRIFNSAKNGKRHRVLVTNIQKNFKYKFRIKTDISLSKTYYFDNFFNHNESINISAKNVIKKDVQGEAVNSWIFGGFLRFLTQNDPLKKGVCLVFGIKQSKLVLDLAKQTNLKIFLFDKDKRAIENLKNKWINTGMYGTKITAIAVKSLKKIPITSHLADLVLVANAEDTSADEVIRITKPKGKIHLVAIDKQWLKTAQNSWQIQVDSSNQIIKKPIENSGQWTHQYGKPDNTAFGGERAIWGATATKDFEVQWMGRPGPRFLTDRSGRKPSPLVTGGKMFVQGKESIVCVDAYNGTVYWSKDIPQMIRMNVHHDCSNWATDDDYLYVAHHHNVLKINHKNGNIDTIIPATKTENHMRDWGYIGVLDKVFIGSSIQKGAAYTSYHGGYGWYDSVSGEANNIVMSDRLFAKDKETMKTIWQYKHAKRWILNPTITVVKNQVSFVESRNSKLQLTSKGRGDKNIYKKNYLVSLDISTGRILWEKRIRHKAGITVYYMAGNEKYLTVVSSKNKYYYIYTYDAKTGKEVWRTKQKWYANHHGGHLSRPAIMDNKLIIKPAIYVLDTGRLLEQKIPKAGHGCASYALSEQSIFYRGGSLTQFNFDTDKFSKWERIRTGCWVSTLPAQGMVLSPEGSGGCSCGNWLETSIVFNPIQRAPITFLFKDENFKKKLTVALKTKSSNQKIYYTIDGATPNKQSNLYNGPIELKETTTLKATVFIRKGGKEIPFTREKTFKKI